MAPARGRGAEDSRPDLPSAKDRHTNTSAQPNKNRRNVTTVAGPSSHKDAAIVSGVKRLSTTENIGPNGATGLNWFSEDVSLLHGYRVIYRLPTPTAFKNHLNAAILSAPGIGRHSPTMVKKREKRKVGKNNLALSVRKHFNGLAINESEVIVDFLYKIKSEEKEFKLRSNQAQPGQILGVKAPLGMR